MTGDDLLFDACKTGKLKAVNELIQRVLVFKLKPKADVNARDGEGFTPIFYAVRDGRRDIVRTMLARGADARARDRAGLTPLHHAIGQGHKEIVSLLIAKGADVNARGNDGLNLLQYAIYEGQMEIAKLLIARGAEADTKIIAFPPAGSPSAKTRKQGAARSAYARTESGVSSFPREGHREKTAKEVAGTNLFVAANAPLHEGARSPNRREPKTDPQPMPVDHRLANVRDINDFIFDERDRLMSGGRRTDDSTAVVWDLLEEYRLFRGWLVCDHDEKARAILAYASSEEGGVSSMVGEICQTQEGVILVIGGDLRAVKGRWFDLVELLSKWRRELGIIEASFFDMLGETSILIEPSHQNRLSNIGKVLGGRYK